MRVGLIFIALSLLSACVEGGSSVSESVVISKTGGQIISLENGVCILRDETGKYDRVNRVDMSYCKQ